MTTGGAPTQTLREAALPLTGFGQDAVNGASIDSIWSAR
jgi:hypothetical protein